MSSGDTDAHALTIKEENEDKLENVDEVATTMPSASQLTSEMMQNPQVLAALQQRLDSIVGTPSGYIDSLPKVIKRRIHALKNLQVESTKIEAKFYEEVHELERKYSSLYQPLFEKRSLVVNGTYEPLDDECEWESENEEEEEKNGEKDEVNALANEMEDKAKLDGEDEDIKGIPEFWLTIFKNIPMMQEMIQEHDEPILKSLQDVRVVFSMPEEPLGFTLEFVFDSNSYFSNTTLTKYYRLQSQPDEKEPFTFEGPEIISCTGCKIDWVKGKNVTVKTIKKKQKHKGRGVVRTVTKQVNNDSFFNFFAPPDVPEDDAEMDEDTENLLSSDFEIGHMIRERVVPRAVLYFTGEAGDDFDEEEEDEDDDDDDDERRFNVDGSDSDSQNDSDYDPDKDPKSKETPQECKQQ
uniref:nucleosome assembly protein 1-like 1 n=1 Tax=Ciona intestinalis TaxID=7719 RepID=UPI00006A4FB8|nr:nucleosome assembly protein 1-like 1 [Ciona intestinalis]|eukprot:XP_009858374.1 nucleosome assembly protein 1-like 1 [Ciona intestinalis]